MGENSYCARLEALLKVEPLSPRLREATTHRTYAVENSLEYDNQRLEFLGDAVLEVTLTRHIFNHYPEAREGVMTQIRSALAREKTLAGFARKLDLGRRLRIGKGERENGGADRNSTLADLFEAVLGALYLEQGEDFPRGLVTELIAKTDEGHLPAVINPKGRLQEYSQKRWGITPRYAVLCQTGPQHAPWYQVEVMLRQLVAVGCGVSRKVAECEAAETLIAYFHDF